MPSPTVSVGADAPYVFNPFASGFSDDPYPYYAQLRAADPGHEHPLGFWVVGHYAEVAELLRSGHSVEDRNAGPSPLRELRAEIGERTMARSMLDRDPPDHHRLRRLVSKAFTPRSIEALEPRVVELVDRSLDRIAERVGRDGQADLVEELAYPLPFTVICDMLGMPDTDHVRLRELAGVVVRGLEPVNDPDLMVQIARAGEELRRRIAAVIEDKRRIPGQDLLTALIEAEEDGDKLSDEELVAQVLLLYVAGHETTVNLISNGTIALLRNPDQLALLRDRPDLDGPAVEELLRYDSPVQHTRRFMLAPHPVGDRVIPVGAFVIAELASANRDERYWGPDAAQLRLDRANARQHLSFGGGPHHCLGAALARLEGRIAIGRLVRRFPALALAGDIRWNGRINLRGPLAVPITV
ncbi:MAG TPA: cytochrome P450 [Pseudonocardia sp.]|jgi:cytochrome P450